MDSTLRVTEAPAIIVPADVRAAANEYLAAAPRDRRGPAAHRQREKIAAWLKSQRGVHPLFRLTGALGLHYGSVSGWPSNSGLDIGSASLGEQRHARPTGLAKHVARKARLAEHVYLEEFHVPPADPTPAPVMAQPKPLAEAGQFKVQVIQMSGDKETVQAVISGLRELLKKE